MYQQCNTHKVYLLLIKTQSQNLKMATYLSTKILGVLPAVCGSTKFIFHALNVCTENNVLALINVNIKEL